MSSDTIIDEEPLPEESVPLFGHVPPQKIGELDMEQSLLVRERQQGRAKMMGLVLGGLCILFFAITIAKIGLLG